MASSTRREIQIRLTEIEVGSSARDKKIIGIFRYEPDSRATGAVSGKRGPTLLMLAEINSTLYIYEQLLDALNATIEHLRPLISGVDADPMARFEKLIQRLNEAVASFVHEQPTAVSWNRVNLFLMEFSDSHLCLSGLGRLSNVFLQKQPNGGWKGFDLFGSLEQPEQIDQKKIFAGLICGDLHPGDLLFAGTQNFERVRQDLQLIDRLKSLPPVTAAMEIKQDLEAQNIPDDFAGAIVASVELPTPIAVETEKPVKQEQSTISVARLHEEEKKTQAMLSPTIAPLPTQTASQTLLWKERLHALAGRIRRAWHIRRQTPRARRPDALALASLRGMNAGHGNFFTLKRRRLILLSGVGIALIAAALLWYRHARNFAAAQTLWNVAYNQLLDRKNRADADLVMGNESRSSQNLREANDLLAQLDEKTTDRKKAKERLRQEIAELQTKLRHERRLSHSAPLFALSADAPMDALDTVVVYQDVAFSADNSRKMIMRSTPGSKNVSTYSLPEGSGAVIGSTATPSGVLFLTDAGKIFSLKPEENLLTELTAASTHAANARAVHFYIRRLYVLDAADNMIWKYAVSADGLSGKAPYLKQSTHTLAEATSLAINSNVYVGFRDGRVVRYYAGAEDSWKPAAMDPPLASVSAIWTHPDLDRIVLADRDGRRLVVLRKDGALVAQILSDDFKGPTAVTGDEKNNRLYVVDGNRLFQIDLP